MPIVMRLTVSINWRYSMFCTLVTRALL